MLYFQDVINKLQQYWQSIGCMIAQPFCMEMGAATFHPLTFFSAINPQNFKAAFVQNSRRPTDVRYGDKLHHTACVSPLAAQAFATYFFSHKKYAKTA